MVKVLKRVVIVVLMFNVLLITDTFGLKTVKANNSTVKDVLNSRVVIMDFDDLNDLNVKEQKDDVVSRVENIDVTKNDIQLSSVPGIKGQAINFMDGDDHIGFDIKEPLIANDSKGFSISFFAKNFDVNYQSFFTVHDFKNNKGIELMSASMSFYEIDPITKELYYDGRNSFPYNTAGMTINNKAKIDSFLSYSNGNADTFGKDSYSNFFITIDLEDGVRWYRDGLLKFFYPISGVDGKSSIDELSNIIVDSLKSDDISIKIHSGFSVNKSKDDSIDEFVIYDNILSFEDVEMINNYYIDGIEYDTSSNEALKFDFEDASNPVIETPLGNTGDWSATVSNGITTSEGKVGNGYYISSKEQHVKLEGNQSLIEQENEEVSFSLWAMNWSLDWQGLVSVIDNDNNLGADITFGNTQFYQVDEVSKEPIFETRKNTFPGKFGTFKSFNAQADSFLSNSNNNNDTFGRDKFSFFTFTISIEQGIKLYRDGDLKLHYPSDMETNPGFTVKDTVETFLSGLKSDNPTILLHKGVMNVNSFGGVIDEFTVYDKRLETEEIRKIYRNSLSRVSISFETNRNLIVEAVTGVEGQHVLLPQPTYPNERFMGWYLDEELTELYVSDVFPKDNIILYAKWDLIKDVNKDIFAKLDLNDLNNLTLKSYDGENFIDNDNYQVTKVGDNHKTVGGIEGTGVLLSGNDSIKMNFNEQLIADEDQSISFSLWVANSSLDWHGAVIVKDYKNNFGFEFTFGNILAYPLNDKGVAIWNQRVSSFPSRPGVESYNGGNWDSFLAGNDGDKYNKNEYALITYTIDKDLGIKMYRDGVLKLHYPITSSAFLNGANAGGLTISESVNKAIQAFKQTNMDLIINGTSFPNKGNTNTYDDFVIHNWLLTDLDVITYYNSYDLGHSIKWMYNGEEILPMSFSNGEVYQPVVTKDGLVFKGWYKDSEYTEEFALGEEITSNMVLYALFDFESFEINYHLDGGINHLENSDSYYTSENAIILKDPIKEGYIFQGWYLTSDFKNKITQINPYLSREINLYALFIKITTEEEVFELSYNLNGGINNPNNKVYYMISSNFSLLNPTKPGYTFDGWYLENTFVTKVTNLDKVIEAVYAKWTKNKTVYNINYSLDGGTNHSDNKLEFNIGDALELKDPTKDGYLFLGWYIDVEMTKYVSSIKSNNATVYAKWEQVIETKKNSPLNYILLSLNIILASSIVVGVFIDKKRGK